LQLTLFQSFRRKSSLLPAATEQIVYPSIESIGLSIPTERRKSFRSGTVINRLDRSTTKQVDLLSVLPSMNECSTECVASRSHRSRRSSVASSRLSKSSSKSQLKDQFMEHLMLILPNSEFLGTNEDENGRSFKLSTRRVIEEVLMGDELDSQHDRHSILNTSK
jgi:hypothetical protein